MGSRASYIITENGRHEIFYSHWGGQQVDRDFFFGPEVALAVIRATRPATEILDDVWAEGGAIIDVDGKKMRLWGGEDVPREVRLRDLWLALLRISWTGWQVDWASGGALDLAEHLGIPRQRVRARATSADEPFKDEAVLRPHLRTGIGSFLTVRREDGSLHDVAVLARSGWTLSAGPRLLELLERRAPTPIPREEDGWPASFVLLDVARKEMWVQELAFGAIDYSVPERAAELWPGWSIRTHLGGMPQHLSLSGRDSKPYERPLDDHVKALGEIVARDDRDTTDITPILKAGLPEGTTIEVNPLVNDPHSIPVDGHWRMDQFLRVLGIWRRQSEE